MNSTIDFLICTDQKVDSNAANIKVFTTNLLEIKKRIEELIKFKVCLSSPRKLCDYKGLYGLIFQEYTKNYDFWGFCDSDLIFGNIRTFLTDDILNNYDHILGLGHFQLQRTSDTKYFDVIKQSHGMGKNPYWLNKFSIEGFVLDTGLDWKSVFTTEKNQVFDELPYGVAANIMNCIPIFFGVDIMKIIDVLMMSIVDTVILVIFTIHTANIVIPDICCYLKSSLYGREKNLLIQI